MRQQKYETEESEESPKLRKEGTALTFQDFVEASRPKTPGKRKYTTAEQGIRQLQRDMPTLDTGKLMEIIAEMPQGPRAVSRVSGMYTVLISDYQNAGVSFISILHSRNLS